MKNKLDNYLNNTDYSSNKNLSTFESMGKNHIMIFNEEDLYLIEDVVLNELEKYRKKRSEIYLSDDTEENKTKRRKEYNDFIGEREKCLKDIVSRIQRELKEV